MSQGYHIPSKLSWKVLHESNCWHQISKLEFLQDPFPYWSVAETASFALEVSLLHVEA
jgi:hypothetical protein